MLDDQYKTLKKVLNDAYLTASMGKGLRHADDKPFEKQIGCWITENIGLAFPLGQVIKKAHELVIISDKDKR